MIFSRGRFRSRATRCVRLFASPTVKRHAIDKVYPAPIFGTLADAKLSGSGGTASNSAIASGAGSDIEETGRVRQRAADCQRQTGSKRPAYGQLRVLETATCGIQREAD